MRWLAGLLLAAALAACSPTAAPPARAPVPEQPQAESRVQLRAELAAGNFASALSRIARQVEAGRPESEFAAEYPQAINGVLALAAGHIAGERYEQGGPLLRQALDAYPRAADLARRVTTTPEAIRADLQRCTDRVMEKGLLAYRAGRLEEAVGIWKRLLAFNPDHPPARQAVETATLQLRNLRAIK